MPVTDRPGNPRCRSCPVRAQQHRVGSRVTQAKKSRRGFLSDRRVQGQNSLQMTVIDDGHRQLPLLPEARHPGCQPGRFPGGKRCRPAPGGRINDGTAFAENESLFSAGSAFRLLGGRGQEPVLGRPAANGNGHRVADSLQHGRGQGKKIFPTAARPGSVCAGWR